ncbi:MAG: DNA-directed RNA polymerase subunit alpha [Candidatus Sumerlaeia bacterium]
MQLKPLIIPKKLFCDMGSLTDTYGRFVAEPFERGFGTTLGNSLRRVLLSSIQGAAPICMRIEGVDHEFATLPNVKEDVQEIILNVKSLHVKMDPQKTRTTIFLDEKGPKEVTAADFQLNDHVQIMTPQTPIATLSKGAHLKMELTIGRGRGYVTAAEHKNLFPEEEHELGLIFLDAAYSPIKRVKYEVEAARVGDRTDYDRLIMEIFTNGTVKPEEAMSYAARILQDHLDIFIQVEEEAIAVKSYEEAEEEASPLAEMQAKLDKSIEELELSVRSYNCLEAAGIKTIRDLVQKTEQEMLRYRNFGRKSLSEIKNILKDMGLSFNMKFDEKGIPLNYPIHAQAAEEKGEQAS